MIRAATGAKRADSSLENENDLRTLFQNLLGDGHATAAPTKLPLSCPLINLRFSYPLCPNFAEPVTAQVVAD